MANVVSMTQDMNCERCGEPIAPPDQPVKMAKQVDVTGFNAAGTREYLDGIPSIFHEWCAPSPQVGRWRRVD